jgi:predicted acylesterase/phospholipase RssA/drug/metabolite transporter (DMT)-like permease
MFRFQVSFARFVKRHLQSLAITALCFAGILWSVNFVIVKEATQAKGTDDGLSVFAFLALRFSVTAISLAPIVLWRRIRNTSDSLETALISIKPGVIAGLLLLVAYSAQTYGIKETNASKAAFLTSLYVMFVPLIGAINRTGVPTLGESAFALLALIGAVIMSPGLRHATNVGDVLLVLGSLFFALQITLVGLRSRSVSIVLFLLAQFMTLMIGFWLLLLLTSIRQRTALIPPLSSRLIWEVLFAGTAATTIAYALQAWAQRYVSTIHTTILLTVEPVLTALLARWYQGDPLPVLFWLGAALILIAIVWTASERAPKAAPAQGDSDVSSIPLPTIPSILAHESLTTFEVAPPKISTLILKGGGAKGIAFTGVVEVLEHAGYKFKTYVGTSAGAIMAVLLAAGYDAAALFRLLVKSDFASFKDAGPFRMLWNLIRKGGLYEGKTLRIWVHDSIRAKSPFQNVIRFPELRMSSLRDAQPPTDAIIFASHPLLGTLVFDSSGENQSARIQDAVRLSASLPGFFVPGEHEGHRIYDGGLLHNFPVEVYQRVRPTKVVAQGDNFIAVYLGIPADTESQRFWFLDVLQILFRRDDRILLQKHENRSLLVETAPVGTRDFQLDAVEKDWLVSQGRLAALGFLRDQFGGDKHPGPYGDAIKTAFDAVKAETVRLKPKVDAIRQMRRAAFGVFLLLIAAAIVIVAWTGYVWWERWGVGPDQFALVNEDPYYTDAYISHDQTVIGLKPSEAEEIRSIWHGYEPNLNENCFHFDSVLQLIFTNMAIPKEATLKFSEKLGVACKIQIFEGTYDALGGSEGDMIKLSGSMRGDNVSIHGYLFESNRGQWEFKPHVSWNRSQPVELNAQNKAAEEKAQTALRKIELTSTVTDTIKRDHLFRLVVVARYSDAFSKDQAVSPWALTAHRFLKNTGTCVYAFVASPADSAVVPAHIYMRTSHDRFKPLRAPASSMSGDPAWQRVEAGIAFLTDHAIRAALADQMSMEALQENDDAAARLSLFDDTLKAADTANKAFQSSFGGNQFAFTFDRSETGTLTPNTLNLLVILEKSNKPGGLKP